MADCVCELVSAMWIHLKGMTRREVSMEAVLDSLLSQQIQIEIQDRQCVNEARRVRANKALFRAKMLEHRRLQGQLAQLQRYREHVQAHQHAVSNHEINQAFVQAMQGAVKAHKLSAYTRDDASKTMDDLHESVSSAKELTELLGQPVCEDVLDEDLELEFLEATTAERLPSAPITEAPREPAPARVLTPLAAA